MDASVPPVPGELVRLDLVLAGGQQVAVRRCPAAAEILDRPECPVHAGQPLRGFVVGSGRCDALDRGPQIRHVLARAAHDGDGERADGRGELGPDLPQRPVGVCRHKHPLALGQQV